MRYYAAALATLTLLPSPCLLASSDRPLDLQAIATLEGKAERASVRDQCFLYAELMRGMSEIASHQLAAGDPADAAATLASVEHYAILLDSGLARDTKKVKDAEILMRETALRLKGALNAAALEDRPAVEHTLQQLDKLESKLMSQVFAK
jgi:hypothetical protein